MKDHYEQLTLWTKDVLDGLLVPVPRDYSDETDQENHQAQQEGPPLYIQLTLPECEPEAV